MNSDKTNAQYITSILKYKGVKHIVLCPGSRNAPFVISFTADSYFKCYSVVDERSAGFFALGLAQYSKETIAVVCTSGSAVLNLAPAVAEAYYQRLPLLVISADRPSEWVNQGESQTLQQKEIFSNIIRASFDLVQEPKDDADLWFNQRQISEAVDTTTLPYFGPVHINVRFKEPLYNISSEKERFVDSLAITPTKSSLDSKVLKDKLSTWNKSNKILIICGLMFPDEELNNTLQALSNQGVVVLTETTSNLSGNNFIPCIDKVIISSNESELNKMQPELLITLGGPLISRKVKNYLRKNKNLIHWHVDPIDPITDAFQHQKAAIPMYSNDFLSNFLSENIKSKEYLSLWLNKKTSLENNHSKLLNSLNFSDLTSVGTVLNKIPKASFIQVGNSASIRYVQLFDNQGKFISNSNRGTSGIEGSVSTAAGMATLNMTNTYLIIGDLSLRYDSNGLWNNHSNGKLKIIVLNNGGGGIFRIIDGPDTVSNFEEYIETKQDSNFESFAACYKLNYFIANSLEQIESNWQQFSADSKQNSLLEICTSGMDNAGILKDFFEKLK